MILDNNQQIFIELLKAGLWKDKNPDILIDEMTDWNCIYRFAQEQSVQGLILQGIEKLRNCKDDLNIPQVLLLRLIGEVQMIEQKNQAMNRFVERLIGLLRKHDIYALLVKGQGIAQCYERPLWRSSGDIDLFLDEMNYDKAKKLLLSTASSIDEEDEDRKHIGMNIDSWIVELHGSLRTGLGKRVNRLIDDVQKKTFDKLLIRIWKSGETEILLPNPDNDIIYVFTHILNHFFNGGIGLRQICDWCRLLWIYRDSLNCELLERRIRKAGLMTEWKAFATLAVDFLGMQVNSIPFYDSSKSWSKKSSRILSFILETGNFGHNRDDSYYQKHSFVVYKMISLWRNSWDSIRHMAIFPVDAYRVWYLRLSEGVKVAARGK